MALFRLQLSAILLVLLLAPLVVLVQGHDLVDNDDNNNYMNSHWETATTNSHRRVLVPMASSKHRQWSRALQDEVTAQPTTTSVSTDPTEASAPTSSAASEAPTIMSTAAETAAETATFRGAGKSGKSKGKSKDKSGASHNQRGYFSGKSKGKSSSGKSQSAGTAYVTKSQRRRRRPRPSKGKASSTRSYRPSGGFYVISRSKRQGKSKGSYGGRGDFTMKRRSRIRTPSPTKAPTSPTQSPTTAAPVTTAPTLITDAPEPATQPPSSSPTVSVPDVTSAPTISTPAPTISTPAPTVEVTTAVPATTSPTSSSVTSAPTTAAATNAPTSATEPPDVTESPTTVETTAPPTLAQTNAPTLGTTTLSPTVAEATTEPTAAQITAEPTAGATTAEPTAGATTAEPTAGATTAAPTAGATTTSPETEAPTEPLTDPTIPPDAECQDNLQNYNVNIDLQIGFEEDIFAACVDDQDQQIASAISDAMNEAFPTTVSDWDGEAFFGPFGYDPSQEVNNVGRLRRRQLRGNTIITTTSAQRDLQEASCSSRGDIDCFGDYCRWGCLTAATSDCGTSSLANWANLGEDIRTRLIALGFDCLGIPDELEVIVLVDEPEEPGSIFGTSRSGENGDPNKILTDSEATPETEDDSNSKIVGARVKLQIHFFDGKAEEPTQEEIVGLIRETQSFFIHQFSTNPDYATSFLAFYMREITHAYDEGNEKDQFELDFLAGVEVLKTSPRTSYEVSKVMSHMDYNEYISDYVWKTPPLERSEFYQTHFVKLISKPVKHFSTSMLSRVGG